MKIRAIIIVLAISATILLLISRHHFTRYGRFTHQNQQYYAQIAAACDYVRAMTPITGDGQIFKSNTNGQIIIGRDQVLPPILQELHPYRIEVESNRVCVGVGWTRDSGFTFAWQPSDYNNPDGPWELETCYAYDKRKVLFKMKKSH